MKLLVQPGDGIEPLVKAINSAQKSVEILIFRLDRREIERALEEAVDRGVFVHALIAYTNRGGEKSLRKLEMRLLEAGVTVARTSDDLVRYHGKLILIDRRILYLLAFNFTYQDINHSRSFGIVTKHSKLVQEAAKLFEADTKRKPYTAGNPNFIVSPVNARKELASFIKGAKKELLIYDPKISDPAMIRLLADRRKDGVQIKIIGRLISKNGKLPARQLSQMQLHTRTIIRDRRRSFTGSQSLRALELDGRREVGIIVKDTTVVNRLVKIFEEDWAGTEQQQSEKPMKEMPLASSMTAKKVAKAITNELPPVTPVLQQVIKEVAGPGSEIGLKTDRVEQAVKEAIEEVVKDVVKNAVEELARQKDGLKPEGK